MIDREVNDREDPDQPGESDSDRGPIPAIQRFYENIWLWAVLAIVFWALSYLVWGYVDLMLIEAG